MTENKTQEVNNAVVRKMFEVGAHYGFSRAKRHPSVERFIFGNKGKVDIFNLESTSELLASAKETVKEFASLGKTILFVGGKHEAQRIIRDTAMALDLPYVADRWVGGTLTNFPIIRKRVEKMEKLKKDRDAGELSKYTKKEQLLISREIDRLEKKFGGLVEMNRLPDVVFVVDIKHESIAVNEAKKMNIPVVGISNTDGNISDILYPIVGNDSTNSSIQFFVSEIAHAITEGRKNPQPKKEAPINKESTEKPRTREKTDNK